MSNASQYVNGLFSLEGKVATIIGGAGVLGGALAKGLAQAGAHVVIADLSEEGCKARVAEFEALGATASYVVTDVTNKESLQGALAKSLEPTGKVDICINGAGVNKGTRFLEHEEKDWDFVMNINLKGVFLGCQVFGEQMKTQNEGAIVNIGSVTSHLPLSKVFGYSASKAAVLNLTRNVAQDLAEYNVRCNAICPGFFPAEQNRKLLDEARVDSIMRGTPMNRYGEPEELIGALILLCAPAGGFITGTHVNVDGGFTAAWF